MSLCSPGFVLLWLPVVFQLIQATPGLEKPFIRRFCNGTIDTCALENPTVGFTINPNPASSFQLPPVIRCKSMCKTDPDCTNINFRADTNMCELYHFVPTAFYPLPNCFHFESCLPPLYRVDQSIINTQTVSCPPFYTVLSCGDVNTQTGIWDRYRSTAPVANSSCQCHDSYGILCVAWCSIYVNVRGYQIATVSGIGVRHAYCPSGTKVLGCHVAPLAGDANGEKWRNMYPLADGSGCYCYDNYGGECYATCASNVANYEIVSVTASGNTIPSTATITVTCSPNNIVLGCGIIAGHGTGSPEHFRTYGVASSTSCQCYDEYTPTCYAICGQLGL